MGSQKSLWVNVSAIRSSVPRPLLSGLFGEVSSIHEFTEATLRQISLSIEVSCRFFSAKELRPENEDIRERERTRVGHGGSGEAASNRTQLHCAPESGNYLQSRSRKILNGMKSLNGTLRKGSLTCETAATQHARGVSRCPTRTILQSAGIPAPARAPDKR